MIHHIVQLLTPGAQSFTPKSQLLYKVLNSTKKDFSHPLSNHPPVAAPEELRECPESTGLVFAAAWLTERSQVARIGRCGLDTVHVQTLQVSDGVSWKPALTGLG